MCRLCVHWVDREGRRRESEEVKQRETGMSVSCQSLSYVLTREEDRKRETVSMCWPVHPKSSPEGVCREETAPELLWHAWHAIALVPFFFFSFFFLSFLKCLTSLWCFSRQEMNGMINVNGDPALFYVRTFIATRLDTLERHTHKYRRKRKPTLTGSRRTVFPLGVVTGWFKGPRWNTFIITILSLEPLFVFN